MKDSKMDSWKQKAFVFMYGLEVLQPRSPIIVGHS